MAVTCFRRPTESAAKPLLFLVSISAFSAVSSYVIWATIDFAASSVWVATYWMSGFVILTFNVGYVLVSAIASRFVQVHHLQEVPSITLPKTALIYVVRNEHLPLLRSHMRYSLKHNFTDNVDLWLLSNSEDDEVIRGERLLVSDLETEFGTERVGYFQTRSNPLRRKHVCVHEWARLNPEYKYFGVCDADSRLPARTVERLVRKAEHPANHQVTLFQSHIKASDGRTRFSRLLGPGQDISQKIYATANQAVFERGVSFGSGCLVRRAEFQEIQVPPWVLSHDIWDTVMLEERGHRVVFCGDVVTFGGYPSNLIEYLRRGRRWILGTFESLSVCLRRRISLGTRFMVLYPIYMYACQPVLLAWIISGLFLGSEIGRTAFVPQRYAALGASYVDLEMGSHLFLTLAIILGHRFISCDNFRQAITIFVELLASLVMCLNSIVFDSIAVLEWMVKRKKGRDWVPMNKNPNIELDFAAAAWKLWPTTVLGITGLAFGFAYSRSWALVALPFLLSFTLGIPAAYWSARADSARTDEKSH